MLGTIWVWINAKHAGGGNIGATAAVALRLTVNDPIAYEWPNHSAILWRKMVTTGDLVVIA
jgi:hypothetical protein